MRHLFGKAFDFVVERIGGAVVADFAIDDARAVVEQERAPKGCSTRQ